MFCLTWIAYIHILYIWTSKLVSNWIGMKMSFNGVKIDYLPQNCCKQGPDCRLFFSIQCIHLQFLWTTQGQITDQNIIYYSPIQNYKVNANILLIQIIEHTIIYHNPIQITK